jgi:hypothetical protein
MLYEIKICAHGAHNYKSRRIWPDHNAPTLFYTPWTRKDNPMSKTLHIKKLDVTAPLLEAGKVTFEEPTAPAIETFTEAQLLEQLAKLTGKKPLGPRPDGFNGIWDETSMLPVAAGPKAAPSDPSAPVSAAPQLPPAIHGSFGLNGVPLIAPGVSLGQHVNPATGLPYVQVGPRPATQISPPPSRNFR